MEPRFAFKIDKALKSNLYKICRLCGIDNPEKVPILTQVVDVDGEPELVVKIKELIGLQIAKNDKMPQDMCTLCVDKINDFYEFREMCLATNVQTRKLLGIKNVEPKQEPGEIKPEILVKEECKGKRRGRKRKSEEMNEMPTLTESQLKKLCTTDVLVSTQRRRQQLLDIHAKLQELQVKPKIEIKKEKKGDPLLSSKYKVKCNICSQGFCSKLKMEKHRDIVHVPSVPRYVCIACNETIKKALDIKNHQLWHKLTKTAYECGACSYLAGTLYQYSRHLREHCHTLPPTILDRVCPQCSETFATNFLYNIHGCAMSTMICAGCDRLLRSEMEYKRHTAQCQKCYETHSHHISTVAATAECNVRIKNEADIESGKSDPSLTSISAASTLSLERMTPLTNGAVVAIPCANEKAMKSNKLKHNLKRIDDLIQSTISTLASIKQEPNQEDLDSMETIMASEHYVTHTNSDEETNCFDNGIENDTYQSDSNNSTTEECLEVQLRIKEEVTDNEYKEKNADNAVEKVPMLKLKIKKEHGSLSSSLIDEPTFSERKKKKKKHRENASTRNFLDKHFEQERLQNNRRIHPAFMHIKQERIEDDEINYQSSGLQIASITSGAEFGSREHVKDYDHALDVKPNREELDRLLGITRHINPAAAMEVQSNNSNMPRITAVHGGCDMDTINRSRQPSSTSISNVVIKTEPLDQDEPQEQEVERDFNINAIKIKSEPGIKLLPLNLDKSTSSFVLPSIDSSTEESLHNVRLCVTATEQIITQDQENTTNSGEEKEPVSAPIEEFNIETQHLNIDLHVAQTQENITQNQETVTKAGEDKDMLLETIRESVEETQCVAENEEKIAQDQENVSKAGEENNMLLATIQEPIKETQHGNIGVIVAENEERIAQDQENVTKTNEEKEMLLPTIQEPIKETQHGNIGVIVAENEEKITQEENVEVIGEVNEVLLLTNECSSTQNVEDANQNDKKDYDGMKKSSSTNELRKVSEGNINSFVLNESNAICLDIVQIIEHESEAQPFQEQPNGSSVLCLNNNNANNVAEPAPIQDEETENILNQYVLEQIVPTNPISTYVEADEDCVQAPEDNDDIMTALEVEPLISATTTQQIVLPPIEETDNLINERQQEQLLLQEPVHHICPLLFNDGNVNEIAENNNNANIERELRDEGELRVYADIDVAPDTSNESTI